MNEKIKSIKEKVIEKINSGQIYMKPKWFFVVRFVFRIISAFIVFFAILYILSFVVLVFKEKGPIDVLGMGTKGVHIFISTMPWLLMFAFLVLLIVLEFLVRKFAFVYKKPLLYSIFALVFVVLLASFALVKIDRDFKFARFGERPEVPFFGPINKHYRGEYDNRPMNKRIYKNKEFMEDKMFRREMPPDEIFFR